MREASHFSCSSMSSDGVSEDVLYIRLQKDWKKFRTSVEYLLGSVRTMSWILIVWSLRFCVEPSDLYWNISRRVLFWCCLKL
jgi:hypothetical protein